MPVWLAIGLAQLFQLSVQMHGYEWNCLCDLFFINLGLTDDWYLQCFKA